jgi:hypothetical protein
MKHKVIQSFHFKCFFFNYYFCFWNADQIICMTSPDPLCLLNLTKKYLSADSQLLINGDMDHLTTLRVGTTVEQNNFC